MSATWIIYFASVSNNLTIFLGVAAFVLGFGAFVTISASEGEMWKEALKAAIGAAVCTLMFIFTPDKDTIYLMAGAKVTEDIVKSPEAKELGGKILKVINQKLDEQVRK